MNKSLGYDQFSSDGCFEYMYFHYPTLCQILKLTFSPKYFHPVHGIYALVFLIPFLLLQFLVTLLRQVDKFLYPGVSQQKVTTPIYIIGNPRSGTTFLHRLLCNDPQFTYTSLIQTIFPSVTGYRLLEIFAVCNQRLGGVFTPIVNRVEKKGFSGWETIHKTKLNEAEEDEQLFVFTLLSPVITLLFPFFDELNAPFWVDYLPNKTKQQLMSYYLACLQTHLYATGGKQTLLVKNTTCTGRLESMLTTFPDAKIIHVVRHPYAAIASFLSMYRASWSTFVPQTRGNYHANWGLTELYIAYYRRRLALFQELKRQEPQRFLEIRYENLVENPLETVQTIYEYFQLKIDANVLDNLCIYLDNYHRKYTSKHYYSLEEFGISKDQIYEKMQDIFVAYGFES